METTSSDCAGNAVDGLVDVSRDAGRCTTASTVVTARRESVEFETAGVFLLETTPSDCAGTAVGGLVVVSRDAGR